MAGLCLPAGAAKGAKSLVYEFGPKAVQTGPAA